MQLLHRNSPTDGPRGFRAWFEAVAPLGDDDWSAVEARLVPVRLSTGDPFLTEGQVRRWVGHVQSGALRYTVGRDGDEHVTAFDFEGEVAGDLAGFFEGSPASATVTAIEPTEIDALTYDAFAALEREVPALKSVRGAVTARLFEGARARATELQQFSAEDRYRRLLERSPHVVQRVPLYHVASYLGVTPEALSRIRRRVAEGPLS